MPRRSELLLNNFIYHIYNRGVQKNDIFLANRDYQRFLDTLFYYLYYDYPYSLFLQLKKEARQNQRESEFLENFEAIHKRKVPITDLIAYCLMPNHYHLILEQKVEQGVRELMQRLGSSYSHYFNIIYEKSGSLFQGRFKNVLVENEKQLLYLSKYIHVNPLAANLVELDSLFDYPWSSLGDYLNEKTGDEIVKAKIVMQFKNKEKDYQKYLTETIKEEFVHQLGGLTIDDDFSWY